MKDHSITGSSKADCIISIANSGHLSSFLTKKHKLTLAVVNVEIALVEMKTAQVEVEAQIQISSSSKGRFFI